MAKKQRKREKVMPGELEDSRTQEVPTNEAVQPSLFSIAEDETAGAEAPTDSLVPAPNHSEEVGRQPGHAPEELRGERQDRKTLRWLICGRGNLHIVAPCPRCGDTKGGLLLGTVALAFRGVARLGCADCNEAVDYYVEASQGQIWRLDEQEVRR